MYQRYPAERSTTIEQGSSRSAVMTMVTQNETQLEIHNTNNITPVYHSMGTNAVFGMQPNNNYKGVAPKNECHPNHSLKYY
mmetsp:Transcript_45622/g.46073  ORF Transcript_45622/g.46073 Transcript_45622/m.46073 type:complete len:81 (-) Transcript_45622:254-496(-)